MGNIWSRIVCSMSQLAKKWRQNCLARSDPKFTRDGSHVAIIYLIPTTSMTVRLTTSILMKKTNGRMYSCVNEMRDGDSQSWASGNENTAQENCDMTERDSERTAYASLFFLVIHEYHYHTNTFLWNLHKHDTIAVYEFKYNLKSDFRTNIVSFPEVMVMFKLQNTYRLYIQYFLI